VDLAKKIEDIQNQQREVISIGKPALFRLVEVARRNTGQSIKVRRFLLGLYNGHSFPFDLTEFRGLDESLFNDCIKVLTMDARATVKEIHLYIDQGEELFKEWARAESKDD